jgi:hypothetical protein
LKNATILLLTQNCQTLPAAATVFFLVVEMVLLMMVNSATVLKWLILMKNMMTITPEQFIPTFTAHQTAPNSVEMVFLTLEKNAIMVATTA